MPKPTLDEIRASIEYQVNRWAMAHGNMEKWAKWATEGAPAGMVPDGYTPFKQPLGYIVKGAVAQIIASNPVIKVKPTRRGEAGSEGSENIQAFCEANLRWADRQMRANQAKELARNGILKGLAVLRGPIFDTNVWGTAPERRDFDSDRAFQDTADSYRAMQESRWPYRYDVMDPITTSPFDDGVGIVVVSKRLVSDLITSFPEWDRGSRKLSDEVVYKEWFNGEWRCFFVDTIPILKGEIQPCPTVPYQWAYSTVGENHRGARPEDRAKGIFAELENAFTHQNNLLTAHFADLSNRIYGRFKERMGSNVKWPTTGPGGRVVVTNMDDVDVLQQPGPPQDFTLALGLLSGIVETNTYSRSLLGQGNAATATQEGMTLSQARLSFEPFIDAIEQLQVEALTKACYDFKDSPYISSIPLGDRTLKQEDIVRPVLIDLDLMPVDPDKDDRLQATGIQHIQARSLPKSVVQKEFFGKDPDEMKIEELVQIALENPRTVEGVISMGFEKAQAKVELNRAKELAKRIGQGILPTTETGDTRIPSELADSTMSGRFNPENGRGMEGPMQTKPERAAQMSPEQMMEMASGGRIPAR